MIAATRFLGTAGAQAAEKSSDMPLDLAPAANRAVDAVQGMNARSITSTALRPEFPEFCGGRLPMAWKLGGECLSRRITTSWNELLRV